MAYAKTFWRLLGAVLAGAALACTDIEPCDEKGDTQSCTCSGGVPGTQVCLPEKVWADCTCDGEPDGGQAGTGGSGGAGAGGGSGAGGSSGSGGTGGSTGGSGGSSGAGGSTAGTGGSTAGSDGGTVDPMGDGGAVGGTGGAGGSAGTSGGSGTGGVGGSGGQAADPYRACTEDADCGAGSTCLAPSLGFPDVHVCAPDCSTEASCPVPAGSYEAMVVCASDSCRLECTAPPFGAALSCPSGLGCETDDVLGTSYCFH